MKDAESVQAHNSFTYFNQSPFPIKIYSSLGEVLMSNAAWDELFIPQVVETNFFTSHPSVFWHESRWFEPIVTTIENEIMVTLKDVTEKTETQNALIKSISDRKYADEKNQLMSARLNMAVKAGNIGIMEWIPDTSYIFFDESAEEIFGFRPGQFERSTEALNLLLHPDDRDHFWATVAHALLQKKSYRIELRIYKQDGSMRWIQASGMASYDANGNPYHLIGTTMDITARIESESDQKFLSHASELLNGCFDHKEILRTISDQAMNYFCDGVFIDQLLLEGEIKRLMVIHKNPEVVKKFMEMDNKFPNRYDDNPVMDTLITGKPLFIENSETFWRNNKIPLDSEYLKEIDNLGVKSSIRARLKGRESILGMITFFILKDSTKNFTRRHIWLAEELAYRTSMAVENALIHQASLEAIRARDEFLSIASHELKTPLQSLTLQNQMRKRNLDKKIHGAFNPEKINQMIDADLRHLMRINRLIDDMLDISRIRAGKLTFMKESVEFCSFVKDVVERFRPQLESVGCYATANYIDPVMTEIDIYRTEQVIVNLLTNAMKYGAGKPIRIEITQKQNKLQLLVHDKGPGIREQDQERIFERFERAISSNEVSGLGLGLYISRQIVEQNKGLLYVRSVYGEGATFVMELPCES